MQNFENFLFTDDEGLISAAVNKDVIYQELKNLLTIAMSRKKDIARERQPAKEHTKAKKALIFVFTINSYAQTNRYNVIANLISELFSQQITQLLLYNRIQKIKIKIQTTKQMNDYKCCIKNNWSQLKFSALMINISLALLSSVISRKTV